MADGRDGFVTVTQLVKVGEGTALALHTHVLPCSPSGTGDTFNQELEKISESPYAWFDDRHNQELLAFTHDILHAKATENIRVEFEGAGGSSSAPQGKKTIPHKENCVFKRSAGFRGLFVFKPSTFHHHILIPNGTKPPSSSTPCAAFVTDYGRQVLPFLSPATSGRGYNSYKMLPDSLHAFVDDLDVTSVQGIFKILPSIDPKHKLSSDISSYFKDNESTVFNQEDDVSEGFPEVPMAGLKHRASKRKGKAKSSKQLSKKIKVDTKVQKSSNQPLISEVFENCSTNVNTVPTTLFNEADLSPDMIDEFFDFDSQTVLYSNEQVASTTRDSKDDPISGCTPDEQLNYCFDKDATPPLADSPTPQRKMTMSALVGSKQCSNPVSQRYTQSSRTSFQATKKTKKSLHVSSVKKVIQAAGLKGKCLALITKDKPLLVGKEDCARSSGCEPDNEMDSLFGTKSLADAIYTPPSTELCTSDDDDYWHIETPTSSDLRYPENVTPVCSLSPCDQPLTSADSQTSENSQDEDHSVAYKCAMPGKKRKKTDPSLSSPSSQPEQSIALEDVTNSYSNSSTPISSRVSSDSVTSTTVVYSTEDKEDGMILVSSEEEDEVVHVWAGNQEGNKNVKKKRSTNEWSVEDIVSKSKKVSDLSKKQLFRWVRLRKPIIMDIFKGRVPSSRHTDYKSGLKKRTALVHRVDTSMFEKDQVKVITDGLVKIFCSKHMKFFDYVMSVLLPECVIRLIADVNKVSFDKAEQMMYNYDSIDLSQN